MLRPEPVLPGIERFAARTPTLPPATDTNSYALGEGEVLLVEPATPYDDERRAWLDWAHGLRAAGRRLLALVLTHHHADHVGGAAFFAAELGVPIWAHSETAARLPELRIARRLEDGERVALGGPNEQLWDVLHTPGHAPGHLCLHERRLGALVAGDMVASEGTILIDPVDGDMRAYLEQLGRLRDASAKVALPAHGAPIDAPRSVFEHYIAHRLRREARVLAALRAFGDIGAPVETLVRKAYEDTPPALWGIAAKSLLAHLEKLESEGLAFRRGELYVGANRS